MCPSSHVWWFLLIVPLPSSSGMYILILYYKVCLKNLDAWLWWQHIQWWWWWWRWQQCQWNQTEITDRIVKLYMFMLLFTEIKLHANTTNLCVVFMQSYFCETEFKSQNLFISYKIIFYTDYSRPVAFKC